MAEPPDSPPAAAPATDLVVCPHCQARHRLEAPGQRGLGFTCKGCQKVISWDGRPARPITLPTQPAPPSGPAGPDAKAPAASSDQPPASQDPKEPPAVKPKESVTDLVEALQKLAELKKQGLLTDEDFAAMKARIIRGEEQP
jgi:hypothetical protein